MSTVKWSHSALKDYEGCPRRYHQVKVLKKYPFTDTQATIYGKQLHEAAEFYIKDDKPLPPEFEFIKNLLDALKARPGRKLCEYEMGVRADLTPCGFHDPDRWWRGIADLLVINEELGLAHSVDYKTSKSARYADTKQLDLVATGLFAKFPEVKKVKSALVFVVSKEFVKAEHTVDKVEKYMEKPRQDVARIEAAVA